MREAIVARRVALFDDQLGIRLCKGVTTRDRAAAKPFLLRINEQGWRTRDYGAARPEGKSRVLFFGDSFAEGFGVSDGHRFTDVLEQTVPDLEVLNFGVRSMGTDQQLLTFREVTQHLEFDLVVVVLYSDDVMRNSSKFGVLLDADGGYVQKPFFEHVDGELELRNVPVPTETATAGTMSDSDRAQAHDGASFFRLRSWVNEHASWAKPALQRISRHDPAPTLASPDHPAWRITVEILRQWARESLVPLLVLSIPPYQYVEGTASARNYRDRLAELAQEETFSVLDVFDPLRTASKAQGRYAIRIPNDQHFAEAGHALVASHLAPEVSALLAAGVPAHAGGAS